MWNIPTLSNNVEKRWRSQHGLWYRCYVLCTIRELLLHNLITCLTGNPFYIVIWSQRINSQVCELTYVLTPYLFTRSLTYSFTYLLAHSLTHSITYLLTYSLYHWRTHFPLHFLAYLFTYCYRRNSHQDNQLRKKAREEKRHTSLCLSSPTVLTLRLVLYTVPFLP